MKPPRRFLCPDSLRLLRESKKKNSPLTFSGYPAPAGEKQGDLRDNPSDTFSPQVHDEATGGCGGTRLFSGGRKRLTSPLQFHGRAPPNRVKEEKRAREREGGREGVTEVYSAVSYRAHNISPWLQSGSSSNAHSSSFFYCVVWNENTHGNSHEESWSCIETKYNFPSAHLINNYFVIQNISSIILISLLFNLPTHWLC